MWDNINFYYTTNDRTVDYNVSAFPKHLPKNFPEVIEFENFILTKKLCMLFIFRFIIKVFIPF